MAASTSGAALPGANGKITYMTLALRFNSKQGITTLINANGTGKTVLNQCTDAYELDPVWAPENPLSDPERSRIMFTGNFNALGLEHPFGLGEDICGFQGFFNRAFDPSWSPDGTRVAFGSRRTGNAEIFIMNANGTGATRLTFNAARDVEPAWSPNGRKIAFTSTRDGDSDIYVMNAVPHAPAIKLTNNRLFDGYPAWSPDGTKIAFEGRRLGIWDIFVKTASPTARARKLTHTTAPEFDPAWSPDGTQLLFTGRLNNIWDIFMINADGTGRHNLTHDRRVDAFADWQPVCTVEGTAGDDLTLNGTAGVDLICALAGSDVIDGTAGNDSIFGDEGNDQILGGDGDDVIVGGDGTDVLTGGNGADLINAKDGVSGNDTITGDAGDLCYADVGDTVTGCTPQ